MLAGQLIWPFSSEAQGRSTSAWAAVAAVDIRATAARAEANRLFIVIPCWPASRTHSALRPRRVLAAESKRRAARPARTIPRAQAIETDLAARSAVDATVAGVTAGARVHFGDSA